MDGASAIIQEGLPERFRFGMTFVETWRPVRCSAVVRDGLNSLRALMEKILNCPRPTLAVVDGAALGGGLSLAAACAFVLASTRARFSLPEALYGLMPAIIRPALLTRLTPQKLDMLLFTCHSRSAEKSPSTIGPITLEMKQTGERSAGNPHAALDVAGAGNVARSR